ncbi:MAG: hypothetical protein AUJ52_08870 [Elusimicrobia bacterium CG1_02_63_36]|nr:MAG: hypothetical protein AUJ52_08870 [Elusimicrobia bacterium CG1_02_63_36]PIP82647.1 MAG: hypothetical protein COR54_13940 [Elusimicrobia bacterium CG22_combo_CG10-13_8_21_14_all_63_91]PJA16760.1 MAG: hypothetical protein COX66_06835 [Elusimicrobia bacterium CG_4_10_14_0_2_um_filter_63_34]PJB24106.1 MAG: hypothetical protein CO113_15805 [Elusimicrobia bacterium CG_4_9_14_3_um_filter_62_55]
MKSALFLFLLPLLSFPGAAIASLDAPAMKLPADMEPAKAWRDDIVLEAHSPYARLRLTRMKSKITVADQLALNGRDADRLKAQGATVQPRIRAFTTADGRRLLAIESQHRDKPLFTGYVNGPKETYAFLASGLTRTQVMKAVETLQLPGEGAATAMPMPEELRDSPAPLPAGETSAPSTPEPARALMYEPDRVSPWPQRFEVMLAFTMFLVGLGFVWRLTAWVASRGKQTAAAAPGSASNLPAFRRASVGTTPLPPRPDDREPAGFA